MGQSLEGRKKSKTSLEKEGGREREREKDRKRDRDYSISKLCKSGLNSINHAGDHYCAVMAFKHIRFEDT